jgi:hypothetical protein
MTNAKCRIDTVISPDDGHTVDRNMWKKEITILRKILHQFGFIYKFVVCILENLCTVDSLQLAPWR